MSIKKLIERKDYNFSRYIKKKSIELSLDLNYFFKIGFWTNTILFSELILSFIFSILLIRNLSSSDLGLWYLILSIFSIIGIFTLPGFDIISKKMFIEKKYLSYINFHKIKLKGSAIGSIIIIILLPYIYKNYNSLFLFFVTISIILNFSSFRIYTQYLYSKDNLKLLSKISIFKYFIYYTLTGLLIVKKFELIYIFICFFGTQFLIDLFSTIYFFNYIKKNEKFKAYKINKKLGYKFTLLKIVPIISNNLDKILLPLLFNINTLTTYGISLIIPTTIFGINKKLLNNLLFKKTNNVPSNIFKIKVKKVLPIILSSYLLLCIIIWPIMNIFLKDILKLNNYKEIAIYSEVLIILGILTILIELFKIRYESNNMFKEYSCIEIIGQTSKIILMIILIPLFGIWGAIISKGLSEIIILNKTRRYKK